jgi:hypothetical protein
LALLPNVSKVPSLSEVKGFLLEKGQSGKTELPPEPKTKPQRKRDKVRMALSAPLNYQQEAKEIPLYRLPRRAQMVAASLLKVPGEDHSGLALTQLGSTLTPEHTNTLPFF